MSIAVLAIMALMSARVIFCAEVPVVAGRGVACGGAVELLELVPVTAGFGFVFGVAVGLPELVELGVADTSGVSFSSSW